MPINVSIQSRTLNFAISAGAMNRFAPTKVARFNVRDCTLRNTIRIDSICLLTAGYNLFITALNRSIPVVVAVYRFYLVYYTTKFYNIQNKKTLQAFLIFYAKGTFTKFF